ncbi:uncharacterized protein EI90DRAFT_2810604, partial [Cantharellus anzutake]|uniref:uncharacterized protein n=1 Tax=Cantharellus anzutake TaxID=1750568 RepID=UPI0019032639
IRSLYVMCEQPFQEVENFVEECVEAYDIELVRMDGSMKDALATYLGTRKGVKAMFIGTRRNDPHGAKLSFVTPTDPSWPALQRVHPIINWTYHDVWAFLRYFEIPYCSLYDLGYTSLGSVYNTYRNPALLVKRGDGEGDGAQGEPWSVYRPAYELVDGELERAGRGR